MPGTQRYWTGSGWSEHVAPLTPPGPPQDDSDYAGLIVAGFVTALLLPIIGFIIGVVLLSKSKTGSGVGCLVVSVLAFLFWANELTATTYY